MRTDPDYLYKIALMYYKEKLTQQQISEKISISRPMVSRALALAEQCGIVEIKIHSPGIIDSLTEELRQLIGIDSVFIAPSVARTGNDRDDRTADIAAYAPHILADLMETSGKMGIGWGETVYRTVIKMNVMDLPKSDNRYIVPLVNSLGCREPHYQVNVLTSMLAAAVVATAEIAKGVTATRAVALEKGLVFDLMWTDSAEEHAYDWFFHARGTCSTSVALNPDGQREKIVREKLRPECWDGTEAYSWMENPQTGVHDGVWSATWREGNRMLSLVQTSAGGELHAGLGWGKGGEVRQTVVFNRVKGRSVAFGTALALDGQRLSDVELRRDGSRLILSVTVDGGRKTFSSDLE